MQRAKLWFSLTTPIGVTEVSNEKLRRLKALVHQSVSKFYDQNGDTICELKFDLLRAEQTVEKNRG